MNAELEKLLERHIKTHSERSIDDMNAISTLEYFLKSDGKIIHSFEKFDTYPNVDGKLELVPNPEISREPVQNFIVQIKGTSICEEKEGVIKYSLQDLAFPAYMYKEISNDPGILFVVFKPNNRNEERVFWKYMSPKFLSSINFENNSMTITFSKEDEIFNTDESIAEFSDMLLNISHTHSFLKQLETRDYSLDDILNCFNTYANRVSDAIRDGKILKETRDNISKRILKELKNLCESAIILNGLRFKRNMNLKDAWDIANWSIETKFLAMFLQGLKYIGLRIPEDGQNERIMLKYYDFLWKIRQFAYNYYALNILENLEDFPILINDEEKDFNIIIAEAIKSVSGSSSFKSSIYYIQKIVPFYVGKERYFEVTLQLASKYATKYNRLTVYTKEYISTNYSIQIGYEETEISIWEHPTKIKVLTKWRVAIEPSSLNMFALFFNKKIKISSKYNEYANLMNFLTVTGINLLDFIDMKDEYFHKKIEEIYYNCKTNLFKEFLMDLHKQFGTKSTINGRNIIRYVLLHMREEVIENLILSDEEREGNNYKVKYNPKCYPFDRNPIIYNLPNHKVNLKDVMRSVGTLKIDQNKAHIAIKNYTNSSGEIYYPKPNNREEFNKLVKTYNDSLTEWDCEVGQKIEELDDFVYIDDYVNSTEFILNKLLSFSKQGNEGQKRLNDSFIENLKVEIDENKLVCLKNVFINSKILLIYGAAGTGKTTLMNYISNLMTKRKKLFVAKTHTALENLKRRIDDKTISDFEGIDKIVDSEKDISDYDLVFIDECSIIDNRTMKRLLKLISDNSLVILAGDINQIESIEFGNWFYYAKDIMPSKSIVELTDTWRTDDINLKNLWNAVRSKDHLITEMLAMDGPYSDNISNDLFVKKSEDEIVLCLNYDGKFGLNSINNYFQEANVDNKAYVWKEWKYKVGDPILFNESKRFPSLYNNLKGTIVAIESGENFIKFTIETKLNITRLDEKRNDFHIEYFTDDMVIISFYVRENDGGSTEEEREKAKMNAIVPFQLAYAVSIHKAQGLEYDSVKIVIPTSVTENISHGIFYTAITRAKRMLKIYWCADTMKKIVENFENIESTNHSLEIVKRMIKK